MQNKKNIQSFSNILDSYKRVEKHILLLVFAIFCQRLVDSAFFLIFNYYMANSGFEDATIARIVSFRFLGVFLLALPVGLLLKGRKVKPFFIASSILVPIASVSAVISIESGNIWLTKVALMLWGVGFMLMQVAALPYIISNSKKELHSESIALLFQTFSASIFVVGLGNFLLHTFNSTIFSERNMLLGISILSAAALPIILSIKRKETRSKTNQLKDVITGYDWKRIFFAETPTFIIAVGAGLTIQFMNLFFRNVHGVASDTFTLMGSMTYGAVAVGMIFIPFVRRRFGYQVAITLFQSLAVLALFIMASTEWYSDWSGAVVVAVIFYLVRQPLMNVAGPMTSELVMYYVGERNQQMVSALGSTIWTGSWFVGAGLVSILRGMNMAFSSIFMITVGLYIIGIFWYVWIIKKYKQEVAAGTLAEIE